MSKTAISQHCPWDCSGMILLKTDISKEEFTKLNPVLVDAHKQLIVDTVYGTGLATYDSCRFLYYDDFVQYRTGRIKLHHWYRYDTAYYFARGHYLVRFNYCRYARGADTGLYIRYDDPVLHEPKYIEVPADRRIHLHIFYRQIYNRLPLDKIESMPALIMQVNRKEWNLPDK